MNDSIIIPILIQQLEESFRTKAWHGPNLRGSIRGLSLDEICMRPSRNRHNIWEIIVHCAYWKYAVRRRLTGEKKGSFPLSGSNFFKRPVVRTAAAWNEDVHLLEEMHRLLMNAVKEQSDHDLKKYPNGSTFSNLQTIRGIAMHDVYHTGQIQLLKKLQQ